AREVVERGIGIARPHAFYKRRDGVVMLVAFLVEANEDLLVGFLQILERDSASTAIQLLRIFDSSESDACVAISQTSEPIDCILRDLYFRPLQDRLDLAFRQAFQDEHATARK